MTIYKILLGGNRSGLSNVPFTSLFPQDYVAPGATPPVPLEVVTGYADHKHAWNYHLNRFLDFNPPSPIAPGTSLALNAYYRQVIRPVLVAGDDFEIMLLFPKTKVVQITVDVITPVVGLQFDVGFTSGAIASLANINGSVAGFTASAILNQMVTAQDYVSINFDTVDATEKLDGLQVNIIAEIVDFNHVSPW